MLSSDAAFSDNNQLALSGAPPEEPDIAAPSLSLRDFLKVLRRRKAIALNTFVLVVALGVIMTFMTKPVFQSKARVLVAGQNHSYTISSGEDPLSTIFQPQAGHDVDTQVEILRSPLLLNQVFKQAGLSPASVTLEVKRVEQTDVIELTVTSNSRGAAERFITLLPQVYEQTTREDVLHGVKSALEFAQRNLRDQNAKLQRTEAALEQIRNRNKVIDPAQQGNAAVAGATQSKADLSKAQAEIASLETQLDTLISQRHQLSRFIDTPTTTTNPQVQTLRDQLADLNTQRAKLLFLYKPTDDNVRQMDSQIAALKQRLSDTPAEVTARNRTLNPEIASAESKISDTRVALNVAKSALTSAQQQVTSQNQDIVHLNSSSRQQAQLQRDFDSSTSEVATLQQNVMQLSLRRRALEASGSPVTTLETGGAPDQVAPRPARNLILAIALGLLLACAAALLQESLDDHVREESEARLLINAPVLGYFSQLPSSQGRPLLNLAQPGRSLLEQFRVLRSNVQFTLVNSPGKKLLVTSSVPGEGKSYVTSNLGVVMALDGRRVVLVDADLHRPRQHEIFDLPQQPGLTNILVGQASLEEALQDTGIPGLRLLSAGVQPPNPVELLNSPVMEALLEKLQKEADIVLFDSPPMLATADSQVLSAKMDGVLYVMELGRVPRSAVQRAFELLRQARAHIIGVVFNKISEQQRDDYTGYGGYYGQYGDKPARDVKNASLENGVRPHVNGSANTNGAGHLTGDPRQLQSPARPSESSVVVQDALEDDDDE